MKKIVVLLFMPVLLFMGGCTKFLTTTPQDFVTPETFFAKPQDAVLALNAAYYNLKSLWFLGGYWQARGVTDTDDAYCILQGLYVANHKADATDASYASHWEIVYQTVERCNVLLANLDRIDMDEAQRDIIRGEALFLRAYCFFFLVDQWGPVPLKLNPTADANDITIKRSPTADVYAQIVQDMINAESLVPTATEANYGGAGYPSKTTVQAMLARVYLTMAGEPLNDKSKYADAKIWSEKVLDSRLHTLNPDYSDVFIELISNQYDKGESLWEIDMVDIPGQNQHGNLGYLDGINAPPVDSGGMLGQVHATRFLYNLYDEKDLRRDWTIATYAFTATGAKTYWSSTQLYDRCIGKFRLNFSPMPRVNARSPVNFPVLRYADVLLMLAEADNEVNGGPTPLAYDCVNQVRARAYGKLLPGATDLSEADLPAGLDHDSFLKAIQDERCRELAYEGVRKHDLIRWGIYFSVMQAMKADVNDAGLPAVNATQKANIISMVDKTTERYVLWPIPPKEISLNRAMTQNPGW